jgi:translation initiation factor IF-1
MAIPALLVVIVIVMMIERVLHTTYTLLLDEDEVQRLVIYRGRFSKSISIRVGDIVKVTRIKAVFGLSCYLLVQYGACHLISLQPDNEELFMAELNKRQ